MEKNQLILSVKDLNIQFNLRGKALHAIRLNAARGKHGKQQLVR